MRWESPRINQLAFVDDIIIFCKVELGKMKLVTGVVEKYEQVLSKRLIKRSVQYIYTKECLREK